MPKKIDPALRERAVRLVLEHRAEYPSTAKAIAAVARQVGVGTESLRRWVVQAEIDAGDREGQTSEEHAEIRRLKAENRRLREDVAILKSAANFLRGGARPPQPLLMGFIDQMRAEGHAVESIIRVLRQQGVKIAARTYRSWKAGRVSSRTVTDALVVDAVRDAAWTTVKRADGTEYRRLAPEGLYGRKKMTALIRRTSLPEASRGAVDRAMRVLGLEGVTRAKAIRTTIPSKDGVRAGDLLNRDFTAPHPDHTWVMDFTYVRSWAGWVYVAFIVDVYSQRIVAWHAQTSKQVDLVMIPLRMALWERARQGRPVQPEQLRAHSDAGSQYTAVAYTEKLTLDGIAPSIGSVGDAYDNALMETINGLYKAECVRTTVFHDGAYKTISDVEYATAGWVDWYNHRRLHGSLGMVSPEEYEATYYAALTPELLPA
ncbi:IS3 family transposase [Citricoccus sp. NR2]|uniref:IS3 family transposase n=1 Tax=Citricoccus sp. NR2 TaxID=3004095 RepID=UPI0022DDA419|nr:IS3 family transposase [Citricoccus sp. NR2]WBL18241.1 IS3 family transposase [Citricoccus sp. NR2]WBL18788.1 IS3 family transposase [Citricoccus sp. NR2]